MTRKFRIAVLSGLFLLSSVARVHSVRAQKTPPKTPLQPVSDQMTNIPYFSLRDGMSSTLTLNNVAPTTTKVMVTLFNTAGSAHGLDEITLDPHSVKQIQLADVAPQGFDAGNVEVMYKGMSMGVTCQVSVFSLKSRVSFESREEDMMDFESANLAGILSLPKGADGFLAVTNVANNRVTFELTAGSLTKTATLFPRETQIIKLNDDARLSRATLVKLQHNGLPGDLITTGYVLNLDDGYSSGFAMLDLGIMRSSTLAGAHFRTGKPDASEGFPEDTRFSSPLLLANISSGPVVAHVSVDYTLETTQNQNGGDDTNKTKTAKKHPVVKVKDLTIASGDVQRVELSDALGSLGQITEAGVDIAYDAAPGSVIGQLTSVDQSGDYAFEVPIKDPDAMNAMMESIYPWTLEKGTLSVLHLKNTSKETVEAAVLIRFPGGTYQPLGFELQPYQTIAVDIQKIKESKKPDVRGTVFPSNATQGQLAWFMKTPYTMIGRVEGTDAASGIARSFSCFASCCDNYSVYYSLAPDPMEGLVGTANTFSANKDLWDCAANYFFYANIQGQATSWTSNTPAVATVNATGTVYFHAPGSSLAAGHFTDRQYSWNYNYTRCTWTYPDFPASAWVNVNPPDHVSVLVDDDIYPADCLNTGIKVRYMTMQLMDIHNVPVPTNYSIYESYNPLAPVSTCPAPYNHAPNSGVCSPTVAMPKYCTGCTGAFTDVLAVAGNLCVQAPMLRPLGCGFSQTSTWTMCQNGMSNEIWYSPRTTLSNNITVNGNNTHFAAGTLFK